MKNLKNRITPSILISSLALFIALGGASYAALGKNSVGSKQLKKNSVVTKKIKKNAVTSSKIKANAIVTGKIKNNNVTGAKVKESSLGTVPNATNAASAELANVATNAENLDSYKTLKQTRLTATPGATYAAATLAAPEQTLFTAGPVTFYAKCVTDTSGPSTYLTVYAKTSVNGVVFASDEDDLNGDPQFLNTGSPEDDREALDVSTGANSVNADFEFHYGAGVMNPDGSAFEVMLQQAVKNGTLINGNGLYGAGDVCLVAGSLFEFTG